MSGKSPKTMRLFAIVTAMLGVAMSGCATSTVNEATFFADPARFALYTCKQLATVRTNYATRVEELKGLMTKAETGAGGSIMSEMAYRPDYVAAQGMLKSANAAWEENRCDRATEPSLARPPAGTEPAAGRSTGRVY